MIIQADPNQPLALHRTQADLKASELPEPRSAAPSARPFPAVASTMGFDPFTTDFEDLELQAVLRASLTSNNQRPPVPPGPPPPGPARSHVPLPSESGSRSASGTDTPTHSTRYHPYGAPGDPPQPSSSVDKVAASMARNRATMERMLREQEMAQREVYEDEIARFQASENPEEEDEDEDNEMDDVENAIAESRASARTEGHGQPNDVEDEILTATARGWSGRYRLPGSMPSDRLLPFARVYDDDDEALQHALQASLETVPPGFVLPQLAQPNPPQALLDNNNTRPVLVNQDEQDTSSYSETDASIVSAPSPSETSEEVSVEELRRKRLARFGG